MLKKSVRNLQACTEVHLIEHILARMAFVDQVVAGMSICKVYAIAQKLWVLLFIEYVDDMKNIVEYTSYFPLYFIFDTRDTQ